MSIIVVNKPTSLIVPETFPVSTQSPVVKGLNNNNITPAATLDNVPCNARPIAKPAAPKTAMIEVVCTPNCPNTAIKVIIIMPYLIILPIMGTIRGSILSKTPNFFRTSLLSLPAK